MPFNISNMFIPCIGSGKTSLLDVLAYRVGGQAGNSGGGAVTGNVYVNGQIRTLAAVKRHFGYVMQVCSTRHYCLYCDQYFVDYTAMLVVTRTIVYCPI